MKNSHLTIPQSSNADKAYAKELEASSADDEILWASTAVWWGGVVAEFGEHLQSAATYKSKDTDFFTIVIMMLLVPITLPFWAPFVILANITTKCVVTKNSITLRSGLLFKDHTSIRMHDVENIEVKSAIFGTGMVTFRAAGSEIFLRRVARCEQLQTLVKKLTRQRL